MKNRPQKNFSTSHYGRILFLPYHAGYRYAVYQGMEAATLEENLGRFVDGSSVSGYAVQATNWAVGQGIISGYGDNTLRPQGNATRAQAAAMLQRPCEANSHDGE